MEPLNISPETFEAARKNRLPELMEAVEKKKLKKLTPPQKKALNILKTLSETKPDGDWWYDCPAPQTIKSLIQLSLIKADERVVSFYEREQKRWFYSITPAGIQVLSDGHYIQP